MTDILTIPPDKKTGCLLRRDTPGELCGFLPTGYLIDRGDWSNWIGDVERSSNVYHVMDQNGVGSCAAEAANQALMVTRESQGFERVIFSPWFTYHTTSGGRDGGSTVGENLVHLRNVGACPMDLWPRSKGWRNKPPAECYEAAKQYKADEFWECNSTLEVGSALLRGFVVSFGWQGHSCCLTELINETTCKYINSWGNWGDQGFGTIRLSSINFGYGAYAWRS